MVSFPQVALGFSALFCVGSNVKLGGLSWYCEYRPDRLLVPPNLMYSPYRRLFPGGWDGGEGVGTINLPGGDITTHFHVWILIICFWKDTF